MTITEISVVAVGMFLLATASVAAQECDTLQGASPSDLVSYVGGVAPNEQNASCVAFAIRRIGDQRYESAIPVLTKLLDFRWPVNAHQKRRLYVLEHDGVSIYPAATALERIGESSLPSVLAAIKKGANTRGGFEGAVSVWMMIYKNQAPLGVALLRQEAGNTKDLAARQRLDWAAYEAARGWCSEIDKPQCKAAAFADRNSPAVPAGVPK
jgi:hypothetical protein